MSATITMRNARRRRRTATYLWIAALAFLTVALIYWEQTALLYILATLGVTALLVVVALSDLAAGEKFSAQTPARDQPVAGGSGISQTPGNTQSPWVAKKSG